MTTNTEFAVDNNIENEGHQIDFSPLEAYGIRVERQVSLAPHTTIKIGGPAEYFATVSTTAQFTALVRWAQSVRLPYFVLGGGSNI